MTTKLTFGALVVSSLVACTVGPDYEAPNPDLSGAWASMSRDAGGRVSVTSTRSADLSGWWRSFNDPLLASLVERAVEANLDLRMAGARIREARALRGVSQGALLPEVGAGGGYVRQRVSKNGPVPTDGQAFDFHYSGFDAAWEVDVFGGARRQVEAADADLGAAVENLRDVRVTLAADVARNYVELRAGQARLSIARQNLDAQRKTVDLVRGRVDAGQSPELDLARAEAQASTTASLLPTMEAAVMQAIHRLGVLLGQPPVALGDELSGVAPVPAAPAEIPVGLPTDLLRRRPDLRRAEREFAAATARVGVATADLYPKFFLFGSWGAESVSSSDLFTGTSRALSVGPRVQWSLFQGGRIRANIEVHNARQEQAALRFEKALLAALQDVESALVSHDREQSRRIELARAVASQQRAVVLAEQRYGEGLADFLSVLDAQRGLLEAQDLEVRSEQTVALNAVALYKAVGGGWAAEAQP